MVLPIVIWVMRDQFDTIPNEIEQAALVDGCSIWGAFFRIVLPIALPGMVAAFILSLVLCWNEYFFASLLTGFDAQTLPVMVASQTGSQGINWWTMAALSTAAIAPLVADRHLPRALHRHGPHRGLREVTFSPPFKSLTLDNQLQPGLRPVKPVIAMVHLGASPGTPLLRCRRGGIEGVVEGARKDLRALQAAGFDAVMFGNENDRPYELKVDAAASATMAYVVGRLRGELDRRRSESTFCGIRWRRSPSPRRPARPSCAKSSPAPYASDMGAWTPDAGAALRYRKQLDRSDLALLYNVSAEFAYSLDRRSLADRARSAVFSSVPDAILVSGAITGEAAQDGGSRGGEGARLPETPVLANTGVKHATVRGRARGRRRLHRRLRAENRRRHLEAGRSRARARIHARSPAPRAEAERPWPGSRRPTPCAERLARCFRDAHDDSGPERPRGPRRRRLAREMQALGLATKTDRLGNLIATAPGRADRPTVMLFAHMDQLGFVVRKIEANGLIRLERLGGVPGARARLAGGADLRRAKGATFAASSPTRATTRQPRRRNIASSPTRRSCVDAGLFAAPPTRCAAGVDIGSPVVYAPNVRLLSPANASREPRSTIAPAARSSSRPRAA